MARTVSAAGARSLAACPNLRPPRTPERIGSPTCSRTLRAAASRGRPPRGERPVRRRAGSGRSDRADARDRRDQSGRRRSAVLAIAEFVVPLPPLPNPATSGCVNALVALGYVRRRRAARRDARHPAAAAAARWLTEERPATEAEARTVIQAPLRLFTVQVGLWFLAAGVFGVLDATYSGALGIRVLIIVAITGLVTAACAYLVTELLLRPAAVRALEHGAPEKLAVPGCGHPRGARVGARDRPAGVRHGRDRHPRPDRRSAAPRGIGSGWRWSRSAASGSSSACSR